MYTNITGMLLISLVFFFSAKYLVPLRYILIMIARRHFAWVYAIDDKYEMNSIDDRSISLSMSLLHHANIFAESS